ncbi:MAG: tRNA-dihydrouridine synthase, partial [Cardiobacteriaceae bacterium]|nr:tRNA-dihydrouridine synthase [Cardiobacteriaceae bacterium]
ISALAVHGRSRNQRFNGRASFELMANVKAQRRLPIIANGDITHATQAKALIDRYGFDGIMIGRAAQGNPWIFARCQALINTKNLPLPTINTAAQQIYTHIQALHQHYGKQAVCIARKHLHAYLRQHPDYADLRSQINHAADANSQLTLIEKHFTIHTHTNAFQDTSWDANLLSIRQPKDSHAPHYHSRRY